MDTLTKKLKIEALDNYNNLKNPKVCPEKIYVKTWIRRTELKQQINKLNKFSTNNPPSSFTASAKFHSLFPKKRCLRLRKQLYNAKPKNREKVWKNFNLPREKIEKAFVGMVKEHNNFADKKGRTSYLDLFIEQYKIPSQTYKKFFKNADQIIIACRDKLPDLELPSYFFNKFITPCYFCLIPEFPFNNLKETKNYFLKKHPSLNKFKNKIKITEGDRQSQSFYNEKNDTFEIIINKNNNTRHQVVNLIHELAHVANYIEDFQKGVDPFEKGVFYREKIATTIELNTIKNDFPLYHQALHGEFLLAIRRTLFEILLYQNPDQDISKLYAKTLNRCFPTADQKDNPLYVLDNQIVFHPFSSLPHATALAKIYR